LEDLKNDKKTTKKCKRNAIDLQGRTAVIDASSQGHFEVIQALVSQKPDRLINTTDKVHQRTALHRAAAKGNVQIVEHLCNFGANVEISDKKGTTALMIAAFHQHEEIVRLLVQQFRSDPNATDNHDHCAADYASKGALRLNLSTSPVADFLRSLESDVQNDDEDVDVDAEDPL